MIKIHFNENPLVKSLKLLNVEVIEESTFKPNEVYFEDFLYKENYFKKGNSLYYYFKANKDKVSESDLRGVLVYQNKDIDVTLVYKVSKTFEAINIKSFKNKIDLFSISKNRFEYYYSKKDILKFWLNNSDSIELPVNYPLPQCV